MLGWKLAWRQRSEGRAGRLGGEDRRKIEGYMGVAKGGHVLMGEKRDWEGQGLWWRKKGRRGKRTRCNEAGREWLGHMGWFGAGWGGAGLGGARGNLANFRTK